MDQEIRPEFHRVLLQRDSCYADSDHQDTGKNPNYFVLFQRFTLHDRDVGSDGIVHVDAWKYIRVRVSLVEHIDKTGTEVLVRSTAPSGTASSVLRMLLYQSHRDS